MVEAEIGDRNMTKDEVVLMIEEARGHVTCKYLHQRMCDFELWLENDSNQFEIDDQGTITRGWLLRGES